MIIPAPQHVRLALLRKMFTQRVAKDYELFQELNDNDLSIETLPEVMLMSLPEFTILRTAEQFLKLQKSGVPNSNLVEVMNMQDKMDYTKVGEDLDLLKVGISVAEYVTYLVKKLHIGSEFDNELISIDMMIAHRYYTQK